MIEMHEKLCFAKNSFRVGQFLKNSFVFFDSNALVRSKVHGLAQKLCNFKRYGKLIPHNRISSMTKYLQRFVEIVYFKGFSFQLEGFLLKTEWTLRQIDLLQNKGISHNAVQSGWYHCKKRTFPSKSENVSDISPDTRHENSSRSSFTFNDTKFYFNKLLWPSFK